MSIVGRYSPLTLVFMSVICFLIMYNKTKHARIKSPLQYHGNSARHAKHLNMHFNIQWKTQRFQAGERSSLHGENFVLGECLNPNHNLFPKLN